MTSSLDLSSGRRRPGRGGGLLLVRPLALVLLSCGTPRADEPPPNVVPHRQKAATAGDQAALDRLRATVKAQQEQIEGLRSEVARLAGAGDRLASDQATQRERAARLEADVVRYRAQAEALRDQVAALGRELGRLAADKKELVGSWAVRSVEEGGVQRPGAIVRLVFAARTVTFEYQEPARTRTYAYKLDTTEEPREIDIFGGGSRPTLGIYELKGDRLTLAIDGHRTDRPTELLRRPGTATALWTLEREGHTPTDRPLAPSASPN